MRTARAFISASSSSGALPHALVEIGLDDAQRVGGLLLPRQIAGDLRESESLAEPERRAAAIEPGAVLAHVVALVGRAARFGRLHELARRHAARAVFGGEQHLHVWPMTSSAL